MPKQYQRVSVYYSLLIKSVKAKPTVIIRPIYLARAAP